MDSEIQEAFQKELTCLVCLNFLLDPVTIVCGHSFCRSCLCLFWEQVEVPASCPGMDNDQNRQTSKPVFFWRFWRPLSEKPISGNSWSMRNICVGPRSRQRWSSVKPTRACSVWFALKVRSTRLTDIVPLKRLLRNPEWVMPLRALRKLEDGTPKRLKEYDEDDADWNFSLLSARTNLVSSDTVMEKMP